MFGKKFLQLEINCEVTLEEFFYGCKKELYFERLHTMGDEITEKFTVFNKEIEIRPGMGP
jgi:hypothetical protein